MIRKNYKISILIASLMFMMFFSWFNVDGQATISRRAWNYDDETVNARWTVHYDNPSNFENLAVTYNMGEGTVICTGVRYLHNNVGSNPTNVELRFEGDSFWVGYQDLNIPHVSSDSWRTFRIFGPTYLLDDDPAIIFWGLDTSSNCPSICATAPSDGHSYYNIPSGWYLDSGYEYIVDLLYEWVVSMSVGETKTGSMTSTDGVDAYFISLSAGMTYEFELDRTSGSGNLDMRLVVNQDLTNNVLAQSSGSSDPEYMTYTPASSTTYVLLVEADTPGADIADYSVRCYVDQTPNADFTANQTNIGVGEFIDFTFTGSEGNTPTTYLWNFGDGSPTSDVQNPSHQYTSSGIYTVSLTVTDDDGDFDTETIFSYISVELVPIADFNANVTSILEGEFVEFTFTGSEGDPPATYLWDFGDGGPTSTNQNPIYQYTTAGLYTVTLGVTDNYANFDNEIKTDYINVEADILPSSDFIADETNISQGEYVQFTFTGTQGNAPATYLWDFGDGSPTSVLQNPLHQYLSNGIYNVTLIVTDRNGDGDSLVKIDYITVNLNQMPTANFTANTTIIEEMDEVQFNFTGFEGTVPASYQWDFGDGSPISVEKDPIHQYTTAGNYTVSLNVTDNNGDSDVETKVDYITVNINLMPIASFTVNNTSLLENEWVEFTFTGDIGDPPASYLWDFGDGSPTSDAQNPTHQYTTAGTYDVTLVVTDASGDNDTEIKSNYIVVGEFQMSCVINSPQMNNEYAYMAPAYSITVSGVDILTMWYTLNDNNASKYYFTVFSGIIDQSAWDAIPEGHVAIRFYIQDVSRGTINELVIVIKDLVGDVPPIVPPTPGIPGYDLTIIIGSLAIICIVLIRKFSEHYK